MTLGVCQSCGAELGPDSLRLALESGPGPRGVNFTSITGTKLDNFDVCGACIAGEGAANTVLAKMLDSEFNRALWERKRRNRCTIECLRPRHRTRILLTRRRIEEFEDSYCPVCFGPADVSAAPDALPVKVRLRDRWRGRMPLREPWPDPEKRTKEREIDGGRGSELTE
jgi:hypothetical protein